MFTPQLLNKLRPPGLALVARTRFYLGKLVLVASWEDFSAGSVFLAGWLMSCAISYYLLFVFPGCRLLAVELTSSNTKPVVQEFQSECCGGPLAGWHDGCTALCPGICISPNNWEKFCSLLMVSGFLGEAGLPRAWDSEKCLRMCLYRSLFSKALDWNGLLKSPASHWRCKVSA